MTEQNINNLISYLNTNLNSDIPGWFKYFKHKTVPVWIYWTIEILNENDHNNNVGQTDMIALVIYSPETNWPLALVPVIDRVRTELYWANKTFDWFKTYNVDQLWRLDEITARWYYKVTLTVNITYTK